MNQPVRVFTFGPAHGLPTGGPFGLKLEMALRMAGVPYERVIEDDHRKGPKRKSPWIEQGPTRMGDTELILAHLGVDLDGHLDPVERARGLLLRPRSRSTGTRCSSTSCSSIPVATSRWTR